MQTEGMAHHPGTSLDGNSDLQAGLGCAAHWIWHRRNEAKAVGFPFSEETITESVLLDLAISFPNKIKVVPFTKPVEGKIGADWEWCFYDIDRNRFLRFLMQAKALNDKEKAYDHIDRTVGNSAVRQIDKLKATAEARRIPALYVFYNHVTDTKRVPTSACACFACVECWGASVAPLHSVLALLPDKSFDKLGPVSLPWTCLLCSRQAAADSSQLDLISNVLQGLQNLYGLSQERLSSPLEKFPEPPMEPEQVVPNYLLPLLGETSAPDVRIQSLREELAAKHEGVDGVILIDADAEHGDLDMRFFRWFFLWNAWHLL